MNGLRFQRSNHRRTPPHHPLHGILIMSKSLVIGSRPDCDLVVEAASVSGRHCRVSSDEAGYILEDLNSTNGTYFQGKRVSGSIRVALAEDDIIHLGSYALPASKVLASLDRSNAS